MWMIKSGVETGRGWDTKNTIHSLNCSNGRNPPQIGSRFKGGTQPPWWTLSLHSEKKRREKPSKRWNFVNVWPYLIPVIAGSCPDTPIPDLSMRGSVCIFCVLFFPLFSISETPVKRQAGNAGKYVYLSSYVADRRRRRRWQRECVCVGGICLFFLKFNPRGVAKNKKRSRGLELRILFTDF